MSGRLLTCREVAEWLGVTVETILRWHRRGELPGFKLPGGGDPLPRGRPRGVARGARDGG